MTRGIVLAALALSMAPVAPVLAQTGAQAVVKVATVDAPDMPDFRDRLQSALLESGVVRLSTTVGARDVPAPQLVVSVSVSGQGMTASRASAADYCVGGTRIAATADVRVRDGRSGAVTGGGVVTKSVEIGSHSVAGDGAGDGGCATMTPYSPDCGRLSTALALAVARRIAFGVAPLRVAAADGRTLVLSRGGALVPLGAIVQVASIGAAPVRYRVVASGLAGATAEPMGVAAPVAPGTIAELIEDDDPAANARRFTRAELP